MNFAPISRPVRGQDAPQAHAPARPDCGQLDGNPSVPFDSSHTFHKANAQTHMGLSTSSNLQCNQQDAKQ